MMTKRTKWIIVLLVFVAIISGLKLWYQYTHDYQWRYAELTAAITDVPNAEYIQETYIGLFKPQIASRFIVYFDSSQLTEDGIRQFYLDIFQNVIALFPKEEEQPLPLGDGSVLIVIRDTNPESIAYFVAEYFGPDVRESSFEDWKISEHIPEK